MALGFTDGSSAQLVKILANAKEQLQELRKMLDEAKIANDELIAINEVSKQMYEDIKYIQNYSLDSEIRALKRSADNMLILDNWDQSNGEGKYLLLRRQINQRISPEDHEDSQALLARLNEIERIEALRLKLLDQAAAASSGQINTGTAQTSAAVTSSLLAARALEEQRKSEMERLQREYRALQEYQNDEDFISWLSSQ